MSASQRLTADTQAAFPTLIRTVVGSEVHGTGLPGLGDVDHMAIAVGSRDDALGTGSEPETWAYRSAWARAVVEGSDPRSTVGDLDLLIYPARKWARLALGGNPSVLAPIFVEAKYVLHSTAFGDELRENRNRFMSQTLATQHLGYMRAQSERMLGQRSMRVSRPELISEFGFDVKFASHMLRLGYQGLAVLREHTLQIPLPEEVAGQIRALRRGESELDEVVEAADLLEKQILDELETTALPRFPDGAWVNDWLARAQLAAWA